MFVRGRVRLLASDTDRTKPRAEWEILRLGLWKYGPAHGTRSDEITDDAGIRKRLSVREIVYRYPVAPSGRRLVSKHGGTAIVFLYNAI